jgi:hypothetical protein
VTAIVKGDVYLCVKEGDCLFLPSCRIQKAAQDAVREGSGKRCILVFQQKERGLAMAERRRWRSASREDCGDELVCPRAAKMPAEPNVDLIKSLRRRR